MNDLNGRIVLITGAKGGLGSAVTPAFLNAGATVAGVSRSITATDFPQQRFEAFPAELSDEQSAADLVARLFERFGRIDAVVHLMGSWARSARIEDAGASTLDRMLDVNLRSTFFIMSAGSCARKGPAACWRLEASPPSLRKRGLSPTACRRRRWSA
jgi:meso-butanediol dehydrogenase/(S,S)-butanediol dehydrogenase/diacetyl reductase